MPIQRLCDHPGCSSLCQTGSHYCAQHRALRDARARQAKDTNRPSSSSRGYNAKWRRVRAMFLRHNPLCLECGRPAEEVDHIVPKARGGSDKWENLQPLCKSCHSKKTMRENRSSNGRVRAREYEVSNA